MSREIGLALVYRDMWQSSGKYVPRVDQLIRVAPPIIDMGCFQRVETNGGGFEQINLLYGENPNKSVREWTQPFNDAGIKTQMLERGLNGLRMYPVSKELREMMFKLKKIQGTDISRSFDGLNDVNNLKLSIEYAKKGGMISQCCLCITHSPLHTVDYYVNMAGELIDHGAEEIAIKDMAGIGRPVSIGKIVEGIKANHPNVFVQYHGHAGPGFSTTSSLEAARAGADVIDVGMEPLSFGTGHSDLITVHEMLKDAGFSVPEINMKAYMEVRSLTQEFLDDFLAAYVNPKNRLMNPLLIAPGLPGGMMGSLMADLENSLKSLNRFLDKKGKPEITQDELLIKLFDEVAYIWPMMGYPPLVTPYSQYVKNVALMNVMQIIKGKERWSLLDDNTWDMLLGKSGNLPGKLDKELIDLAKTQGREFFTGDPQDAVTNDLDDYRAKMKEKGWELGQDEEELFEYAMHPAQYEAFKSGKAKQDFEKDLAEKRKPAAAPTSSAPAASKAVETNLYNIEIEGTQYRVKVQPITGSDVEFTPQAGVKEANKTATPAQESVPQGGATKEIVAPLEGKFFFTRSAEDTPIKVGQAIKEGDVIGYIEAMKVRNAIKSTENGTVVSIAFNEGDDVFDDDVLVTLS